MRLTLDTDLHLDLGKHRWRKGRSGQPYSKQGEPVPPLWPSALTMRLPTGEVNLVLKGKVIFCQALSFFLQNVPFNTNRDPA